MLMELQTGVNLLTWWSCASCACSPSRQAAREAASPRPMLALTLLCLMHRTSALSAATAASAAGPEGPCSRRPWWGAAACRMRQHATRGRWAYSGPQESMVCAA